MKNSYDADATHVVIELNPEADTIVVRDNGHGMTFDEFRDSWMRVGSRHKEERRVSRKFGRLMTGSKGIGRLSVQYLARELKLRTSSDTDIKKRLDARIRWEEAVHAGDLTEAAVEYTLQSGEFSCGTIIVLTGLKRDWTPDLIEGLAKEIWWLQSPFRSRSSSGEENSKAFRIDFESPRKEYVETFERQLNAILDIWYARLVGENDEGKVTLSLEFTGEEPMSTEYTIPPPCTLRNGRFEIRIYYLEYRQPRGIRVGDARKYLNEFGGVHVYDGGFHLPYYGDPKNDWLRIEFDHSHRLSASHYLPLELQIKEGLNFLPTLSRVLGVVNVDTSTKEPDLKIVITRDRFQETTAFENLRWIVRWAMDFYAMQEAGRALRHEELEREAETIKFRNLDDVIEKYHDQIVPGTYPKLRKDLREAAKQIESEAELTAKRVSLFGPLATAGILSVAFQHELRLQFRTIDDILRRIDEMPVRDNRTGRALTDMKESLRSWRTRAEMTNALFAYFRDSENILDRRRFSAKRVVEEVATQIQSLRRGIPIVTDRLGGELLLPKASLVEWGSIFQNLFLNALNAMMDAKRKLIDVSSRRSGRENHILIQDTGIGVDLRRSESLFEPFVRKIKISPERRALGYGGMGLGLTVVRMIALNIGCQVSFVRPDKGFATAFSIKWKEPE